MAQHALITGPITGRIPHGNGFVDVTPDVVYFDSEKEAQAAADSIESEHLARGTHPVQLECEVLRQHGDEFPAETVASHQAAHKALNKKAGI
jgi:hypothetical protein